MKVLVINCGSSSLKYQLIDMETENSLAQGLVERIGIEGSVLTQKVEGKDKYIVKTPMKNHKEAIEIVLKALVDGQGLVERIGIEGSVLTQKVEGKDKYIVKTPMKNHKEAIEIVLKALVDGEHGVIKSMDEITAVGHRVVHGGEKYASSVLITEEVKKSIEECYKLAPLHNPPNMIGIEACEELMPNTPMVAVFDTAFHQTMPKEAFL